MRCTGLKTWAKLALFGFIMLALSSVAASQPAGEATASGIPVENWVGQVFIVLPLEAEAKEKGYQFSLVKAPADSPAVDNKTLQSPGLEGKQLRVQRVELLAAISEDPPIKDYRVFFEAVADGAVYSAFAQGGQVNNIVLADDFAAAKQYFGGKTVFSRQPAIPEYKETPGSIVVKVDEPLKVVDVILGVDVVRPIWLVVTTPGGQNGYIAIAFSNTNAHQGIARKEKTWLDKIFEKNPRDIYQWPEEVWAAINRAEVKEGMLADQVRLSWGEPDQIAGGPQTGEEVWYYPGKVLRFRASSLYAIEER